MLRPGIPAVSRTLLAQRAGTADQSGLSADARRANVVGAFRLSAGARAAGTRAGGAGAAVVVVDDLVTTGNSLTEAARVLGAAGYHVLGAATVAATVRRTGLSSR